MVGCLFSCGCILTPNKCPCADNVASGYAVKPVVKHTEISNDVKTPISSLVIRTWTGPACINTCMYLTGASRFLTHTRCVTLITLPCCRQRDKTSTAPAAGAQPR